MIFRKKTPPPPCHFRQVVAAKESWAAVLKKLAFRPKTNDLSLRKQSIDAATEAAIRSSYMLLAVELFELIAKNDRRLSVTAGEEPLALECLAFSSSFICNMINPENDDYELYLQARQSMIASMSLMSVLDNDDIENTLFARFDLYDRAAASSGREEYLADGFARVLTYLGSGEYFSQIKIRYEDPANFAYRFTTQKFISNAIQKLKEMIHLVVSREMNEEERFEDDAEGVDDDLDSIGRAAARYHDQIDAQIELSRKFMCATFGEKAEAGIAGRHSQETLSVFAVHAATLLAVSREFPGLHRSILNGFTRTLSFRTPNTMPKVKPPDGTFISYCSEEESFMHKQTEVFEKQGLEPLVRSLLPRQGATGDDYKLLSEHLEEAAQRASRTYLAFIAKQGSE